MNASELKLPDGAPSGVWMCGTCHTLFDRNSVPPRAPNPAWHIDPAKLDEHAERARERAEQCCVPKPCEKCGRAVAQWWCEPCRAAESADRARARFDAAQKLTPAEWRASEFAAHGLFDPERNSDVGHHASVEAFEARRGREPALATRTYLWCARIDPPPKLSHLFLDELKEDYRGIKEASANTAACAEMDAYGEAWWAKYGTATYAPDYTRCVVLAPAGEG